VARKKGAKDKKPRKIPVTRSRPAHGSGQTTPPVRREASPAPQTLSGPERPAIPPDDFQAAIAAELKQASPSSVEQAGREAPADVGTRTSAPSAPPEFDPSALTEEGLANAWRLPFYGLARLLCLLRIAPEPEPIEAVGRRHAKTMAKASYPIWDYYARQYLNLHPDQTVNVAIGVTALDGIGIIPDLIDAIGESRRRFAARVTTAASTPATAAQGGAATS
jgi:hypothetical protein